jgi:hypothetical protein
MPYAEEIPEMEITEEEIKTTKVAGRSNKCTPTGAK